MMLLALPFPWQHLHSSTKTGSLRFLYHLTLYLARALGVKRQPSAKAPIKEWPGLHIVSGPHDPLVPLYSTSNACAPHLLYKLTLSLAEDQQEKRQPPDKAFRLVPGVTPSQSQNSTLGLVQFQAINRCPMLQSIQIRLQGLLSPKRVNSTHQFGIVSKLPNGKSSSGIQIMDQNIIALALRLSPAEHCW